MTDAPQELEAPAGARANWDLPEWVLDGFVKDEM